ncbi:MAG: HAMP domain-containing sensor histidine kinase [Candidatus Sumerlaeia bacterium]|nr:HAMP domain-containing sensor histidine kinase [Candidatus Sumerlaeia bacterium]
MSASQPAPQTPPPAPGWLECFRARCGRIAFPMQAILIAATALLSLGALAVGGYAYFINSLKNELVSDAKSRVELVCDEARREIERVVSDKGAACLGDVQGANEIRQQLRLVTREGSVVMAVLTKADGTVLVQQYGNMGDAQVVPAQSALEMGGTLAGSAELEWDLKVNATAPIPASDMPADAERVKLPITRGGETVGFLEYGLSAAAATGSLDKLSVRITRLLWWMVGIVGALVVASIALLYRASMRHLALQARHNDAQHMAHIGTLASGLAHEIRNPLHAMNLHLEVAREELEHADKDGPARAAEIVGNVQRYVANLNGTLNTFLNYALPKELDRTPIRFETVLQEVVALLRPELDRRGVSLRLECDAGAAEVAGDQSALSQVLTNVILNAAQVLDESPNPQILVALRRQRGGLRLVVEDNGPGIPPGEEERIFEPFVSHRRGGTGFGLAIARRVIAEHGGRIAAGKSSLGGAAFTISLPVVHPSGGAPVPIPSSSQVREA